MANNDSFDRSSSEAAVEPHRASIPMYANGAASDIQAGLDRSSQTQMPNEYHSVLQSDVGVNTLLTRLKQSITSARDFAAFLRKRSAVEEEHAQSLKKLARSTSEAARRPDSRQGSYARSFEDITRIHDRMADNGMQFALSIHQMHEDLNELAREKDIARKQWKQTGVSAEKRSADTEAAMEKAKAKYFGLAEDYDRARTGDKQTGRFGLKGPKSAAQVEEDLNRKMQAADADYASKVQTAQSIRQELVSTQRPQTIQALEQLIYECDNGLTLQMQKFATFNEKLLLSNGICVSPLNGQDAPQSRSLRDAIYSINNDQDLKAFVASLSSQARQGHAEPRYEKHHTQQSQPPASSRQAFQAPQSQPPQSFAPAPAPLPKLQHARGPSSGFPQMMADPYSPATPPPPENHLESPQQSSFPQSAYNAPPQHGPPAQLPALPSFNQSPPQGLASQNNLYLNDSASFKPVFGVSLDELYNRDGLAVPMVVQQCLQAVDMFGLDLEGIYRSSGTATHIAKLREAFDNGSAHIDFRNPENFYHDVNSVAGLLKQFFRDLPDPLLTREHYQGFIEAARSDDDVTRRDSIHATINSLPDPNYATLRALTLHLHRVQEHSHNNRMNAGNLAICFGPTLMVSNSVPNIADAGWQVRVIDTILQNTLQVFDDD